MNEKRPFKGCGAPASRIIYRGATRRLYACTGCVGGYEGSGRPHPYATDVAGQKPPDGHHTGPSKKCGDETL